MVLAEQPICLNFLQATVLKPNLDSCKFYCTSAKSYTLGLPRFPHKVTNILSCPFLVLNYISSIGIFIPGKWKKNLSDLLLSMVTCHVMNTLNVTWFSNSMCYQHNCLIWPQWPNRHNSVLIQRFSLVRNTKCSETPNTFQILMKFELNN